MDNGRLGLCSHHADGHLLGIGSVSIEGLNGIGAWIIVEVLKHLLLTQLSIIRIGIGAVTTTIDIAIDRSTDADGITTIDLTGDIVTAIDIIDMTTINDDTGRELLGEVIALDIRGRRIDAVHLRTDVGHTAATIEVLNYNLGIRINV